MLSAIGSLSGAYTAIPMPTSVTELRFQNFFHGPSKHFSNQRNILEKIALVISTLLLTLIKLGLFLSNPSLTALGFMGGIVWEKTSTAMDEIKLVWHTNYWIGWKPVFVVGSFFTLPAVVSVFSFLWAAELGSQHRVSSAAPERHCQRCQRRPRT